MAGNKNSGRRPVAEEWTKRQALKKAWLKVEKELEGKDVEKIALPLVLKSMVQKQDITSDGNAVVPLLGGASNQPPRETPRVIGVRKKPVKDTESPKTEKPKDE